MFNGGVDVSHMISTMDELKTETSEADPGTRTRGIVTTNIIGHGVDVDRLMSSSLQDLRDSWRNISKPLRV